jgi:hypothetical protein
MTDIITAKQLECHQETNAMGSKPQTARYESNFTRRFSVQTPMTYIHNVGMVCQGCVANFKLPLYAAPRNEELFSQRRSHNSRPLKNF